MNLKYSIALCGLIAVSASLQAAPYSPQLGPNSKNKDIKWARNLTRLEKSFEEHKNDLKDLSFDSPFLKRCPMDDYHTFSQTGICKGCNLKNLNLQETIKRLNEQGKQIDLENSMLDGANLSGANLQGAQLNGIHATCANFNYANIQNASMKDADLRDSYFYKTQFNNTDLQRTAFFISTLKKAHFNGSNLAGCYFYICNLKHVNFTDACTTDTNFLEHGEQRPTKKHYINLVDRYKFLYPHYFQK